MENEQTTELEQEQIETTEEETEETPPANEEDADYKALYEEEKRKGKNLKRKLYARDADSSPEKGFTRGSDAKRWEIMELKTEGYKDKDELDFIMDNGGLKALEKPHVIASIKAIRDEKAALNATLEGEGQKSSIDKKFSPEAFAKLSHEEQLKVASELN